MISVTAELIGSQIFILTRVYQHKQYQQINPTQCRPNYTADIREGVAIEYISCEPPENLKELFPEGYGACDDSFEEAKPEQA